MACQQCLSRGPSSARSFVALASKHASSKPLEFLFPLSVIAPWRSSSTAAEGRKLYTPRIPNLPTLSLNKIRSFTTTSRRRATVCVQNPQQDEEGNPMSLEITTRAAKRLSEIMTKESNPDLALRIQVESGGCHGFQYLMSLITIPSKTAKDVAETSSVLNEDDTIFQYRAEEVEGSGVSGVVPTIILDEPSLDLLKGSKVDFTQELIGSQFKIVDNPYASSSCGCGTSFDIKT